MKLFNCICAEPVSAKERLTSVAAGMDENHSSEMAYSRASPFKTGSCFGVYVCMTCGLSLLHTKPPMSGTARRLCPSGRAWNICRSTSDRS